MIRVLVKLALAAAAVWAIWTFVPVHGRTLAERWQRAGSLSAFVDGAVAEVRGGRASAKPQARSQKPASRERPTEGHTDADRRSLERTLSEHLSDQR